MKQIIIKYLPDAITAKEIHNHILDFGDGLRAEKVFVPMNKKGIAFVSVDDKSFDAMLDFLNGKPILEKSIVAQKVLAAPVKLFIGNIPFDCVNTPLLKLHIERACGIELCGIDIKFNEDGKSKGYAIAILEKPDAEKLLKSQVRVDNRTLKIYVYQKQTMREEKK